MSAPGKPDEPVKCPYCGKDAELVDSIEIYKHRSFGYAWWCRGCEAWTGCHKGTRRPMGRLANAELRKAKRAAHSAFDPLWKTGSLKRQAAYKWLAAQLGISNSQCHIGFFDVEMCLRVVEIVESLKEQIKDIGL